MAAIVLEELRVVPSPERFAYRLRALPGGRAALLGDATVFVFEGEKGRWEKRALSRLDKAIAADAEDSRAGLYRAGAGFGVAGSRSILWWATPSGPCEVVRSKSPPIEGRLFGGVSKDADVPVIMATNATDFRAAIHPLALTRSRTGFSVPRSARGKLPTLRRRDFPVPAALAKNPDLFPYPIVDDAAWDGRRLLVFTVGLDSNYVKWGMSWSTLSTVTKTLSAKHVVALDEAHRGRFSSSLTWLIATPLRQNGPARGKPSLYAPDTGERTEVVLPKGRANAQIEDEDDGIFWLSDPKKKDSWVVCRARP